MFNVTTRRDNSKNLVIGYQVTSESKSGGTRVHYLAQGQQPSGEARAKAWCEIYAAGLTAEAEANALRAAGDSDAADLLVAKAVAAFKEVERLEAEQFAKSNARRLEKLARQPFNTRLLRVRDRA